MWYKGRDPGPQLHKASTQSLSYTLKYFLNKSHNYLLIWDGARQKIKDGHQTFKVLSARNFYNCMVLLDSSLIPSYSVLGAGFSLVSLMIERRQVFPRNSQISRHEIKMENEHFSHYRWVFESQVERGRWFFIGETPKPGLPVWYALCFLWHLDTNRILNITSKLIMWIEC